MAPITHALNNAKDLIFDRLSVYNTSPSLLGTGVRSLKKKFCAGESIPPVVNESASILDCQPLHVEDGNLVDTSGRRRVLKGINVDSAMKLPVSPSMPSYEGNGSDAGNIFFDGQNVSFVGRPFPLEQAEIHLERIKSWGYNTIRYLVCWEAIESQGPGKYDEAFIDYTIEVLRIIHRVGGLYVFLEPHQDVWSRYCGGSGAPMWTLYAAGLQPTRFSACEAALLHNDERYNSKLKTDSEIYPKMLWTSNYKRLASLTMFTLFFAGNTYFPHLKLNGVNIQDYLQSHFLGALEHLWEAVVERLPEMFENGALLGFESINEPNCGLVGSPNLATLPSSQHLRIGSTPAVYDCFRLGMGFPVEMDNYKISLTGPQKCGRVVVDPHGQRAWLTTSELNELDARFGWQRSGWDGTCIFAGSEIWKWKDVDLDELSKDPQSSRLEFSNSSCKLLKPYHFNEVSARVSFDVVDDKLPAQIDHRFFTETFFVNHVISFKKMVRKHAPNCFVLIQPPVLEIPPYLKDDPRGIIDDKTIYCPHYYDGMSLMFKSWNYRYNVDTLGIMRGKYLNPVLGVVFGERAIRNCLKKQFIDIAEEGRKMLGNIPVLMSETGMPFDMNNKKAYEDGRYQSQTSALDALANALEGSGMHHTYWCYSSINCHKWGDRWNNEDFSFWSPDDRDLVFDELTETNSESSKTSSRRRSSMSPSLKSIRTIQETCGTHQLMKAKLAHHKKKLLPPSLFKKSFLTGVHEEYWESEDSDSTTGHDDSSLISVSSDNLRYKHLKQCYPSPDGVRAASAVMRPFLVATVGRVVGTEFDLRVSRFTVTVELSSSNLDKSKSAPTILFVPKWHFPYLNYRDIYLNYGTIKYDHQKEYVEWYHHESEGNEIPREHTIIIKNHSGNIEDINPAPEGPADPECRLS